MKVPLKNDQQLMRQEINSLTTLCKTLNKMDKRLAAASSIVILGSYGIHQAIEENRINKSYEEAKNIREHESYESQKQREHESNESQKIRNHETYESQKKYDEAQKQREHETKQNSFWNIFKF